MIDLRSHRRRSGARRAWSVLAACLGFLLACAAQAQAPEPLPARAGRHALLIGVSHYVQDPARPVAELPGVRADMQTMRQIAHNLQVPPGNVRVLLDGEATRANIEQALAELAARTAAGDRVFVYWSGHGSRFYDAQVGGCVETLIPHDLKDFSNRQFSALLAPIAARADKLMVMVDACHSGGIARDRSWPGELRPRFSPAADACAQPVNLLRTRSLPEALEAQKVARGDYVFLSSSRPEEVSFDSPDGGVATLAVARCIGGEAKDRDGDGAISMREIADCAQARINARFERSQDLRPHHLTLSGNRDFVPAWFAQQIGLPAAPQAQAPSAAAPPFAAASPSAAVISAAGTSGAAGVQPAPLAQVLDSVVRQRDHKRRVAVTLSQPSLRIGRDTLDFSIASSHAGHVYVALLGSDQRSLYLLFPNALDADNRIAAGQTLLLPRPHWRLAAAGPAGKNRLLVLVGDGPRDFKLLRSDPAGPFTRLLTDERGQARLQWLLGQNAAIGADGRCAAAGQAAGCSDAYGAALLEFDER
jgi:hypothetical protein